MFILKPPASIRQISSALVSQSGDPQNQYAVVPQTTHVSILLAPATFEYLRNWTSRLLGTNSATPFPESHPALGCLIGLAGLSLLVPPFLREITSQNPAAVSAQSSLSAPLLRAVLAVAILSLLTVAVLSLAVPFRFVPIFQGGYLASLLFIVGGAGLILYRESLPPLRTFCEPSVLASCAAGLLLLLLFAAWLEMTFYEAWLTSARWLRFPVLFVAFLPWHLAEEVLLGAPTRSPSARRLLGSLALRGIVWFTAIGAIFYLHSGQFLYLLLFVYFLLFSLLQRLAIDAVSSRTRNPSAAAVFGAILLAGFVLAILPVA